MELLVNCFSSNSDKLIMQHKKITDMFLKNEKFNKFKEIIKQIQFYYDNTNLYQNTSNDNNNNDLNINLIRQENENTLDNLTNKLKINLFNLKGKLVNIFQEINSHNKFNLEIKIRDDFMEYTIVFYEVDVELIQIFNKFQKGTMLYFLHLKIIFEKVKNENIKIKFYGVKKTKIFFSKNSIGDDETPLIFNDKITSFYKNTKVIPSATDNINITNINYNDNNIRRLSRLLNGGEEVLNLSPNNINSPNYLQINYNNNNNIILNGGVLNLNINLNVNMNMNMQMNMNMNTPYFYSSNNLNSILSNIPDDIKNYANYLIKSVGYPIYSMSSSNINNFNSRIVKVDVCGIVKSCKYEEKVTSIDLLSLIDSNTMRIIHYPNNWLFKPEEGSILMINAITLKINKNLEFILENPLENNVKKLDQLTAEEIRSFKKFRIDRNLEYGSIIDLIKPVVKRNIQKYLVSIKIINKITARYEVNSNAINGFKDLRLFSKVIIDDGTYEAQMNIYDEAVTNMFRLDKDTLNVRHIILYLYYIMFRKFYHLRKD
jgi:hypothetical protein